MKGRVMLGGEHVMLVVNRSASAARNLKDLIEFMDTPPVLIAAPDNWQEQLGEQCLDALFVGPDMTDVEVDQLLTDIGKLDPNIPIIMMSEEGSS